MDDIKLFAQNENELESLILVGRIYCQDIGWNLDLAWKLGKKNYKPWMWRWYQM